MNEVGSSNGKPESTPDGEDADARGQRRQRVLKGASILKGVESSEVKCTVRNMHEEGALLQVDLDARVPEAFLLYVPVDGVAYKAELRWRNGSRVGVRITGTEPKPRWHYGGG